MYNLAQNHMTIASLHVLGKIFENVWHSIQKDVKIEIVDYVRLMPLKFMRIEQESM